MKKPIHILRKGQGLTPWADPGSSGPGKRIFLVESQKKAAQVRLAFPEDEVVSVGKFPLQISISLGGKTAEEIRYKVRVHEEQGRPLVEGLAKKCDAGKTLVILTEPNTRGEALACGIRDGVEDALGREIAVVRPRNHSLHRASLIQTVEREIQKAPHLRDEPDRRKAASYWVKAAMDITWKKKISAWVGEAANLVRKFHGDRAGGTHQGLESLTRIQCAILHTLHRQEGKNRPTHPFWEVRCLLMGTIPGTILRAHIAVPNLMGLFGEENSLTKKIWQEKLEEARENALQGLCLPQRPPGTPWRFENEEEASLYRYHLKRYPLMVVEQIENIEEEEKPEPPHTTETILETSHSKKWATQKETGQALEELYLNGLITQFKTSDQNLSEESFQGLKKHCKEAVRRLYGGKNQTEANRGNKGKGAIAPTLWERPPKVAAEAIRRSVKPSQAEVAITLYKEIYERGWKSQQPDQKRRYLQITATGPLPITAEDAFQGNVARKENLFKSLMNVVMTGREESLGETASPLGQLQKGNLLQTTKIEVVALESHVPTKMTKEDLLVELQRNQMGKVETLSALLPKLESGGLIKESGGFVGLTPAGRTTIGLLNEYLGNFIHTRYHEVVHDQLQKIESGEVNPQDFLQYWWTSLGEVAGKLPPITEAVADSTGKTLAEIEETLKMVFPGNGNPEPGILERIA